MFESMNHVCDEKVWGRVFSFNFSIFLNTVKKNLEDDLEISLYLQFKFYSFVFSNLSLYSVFSHFCFCKRSFDQKKSSECYCQFCSRIYPQILDNHNIFQDIFVDELGFTREFNKLFRTTSLFSFYVCHDHALFINSKKAKIFNCTYFSFIKTSAKLFKSFISVLIRLYLFFFSLLNEFCLKETQQILFRQQIWILASDHMSDF